MDLLSNKMPKAETKGRKKLQQRKREKKKTS